MKLKIIVISFVLIVLSSIVLFFIFCTEPSKINICEQRFLLYADLLLKVLVAFAVLRLFNAVVANSSYLLKLREQVKLLIAELKTVVREFGKDTNRLNASNNTLGNKVDNLKTAIQNLFKK